MDIDDILRQFHCENSEMTKQRFLNDFSFYISALKTMLKDDAWKSLGDSLEKKQTENAFELAHSLKGSAANCGLTPLYVLLEKITALLRKKRTAKNFCCCMKTLWKKSRNLKVFCKNP